MDKGDTIWKDVVGYEGLYQVSNHGEVLSLYTKKVMKPYVTSKGSYLRVQLFKGGKGSKHLVHRLVAIAFLGYMPYPEFEVNHKDMNTKNNYIENIEWVTLKENMDHSFTNNPNRIENARTLMSDVGKWYHMIGVEASKKPVSRIDKDTGEVIETYSSAREASKQGYRYKSISQVCLGDRKTHKGFIWKFSQSLDNKNNQ